MLQRDMTSIPVFSQKEEPKASLVTSKTAGDNLGAQPQTEEASEQTASRKEVPLVGGAESVEYTELALDCLDLKAQEELLSPPLSGDKFSFHSNSNCSDVSMEDFFLLPESCNTGTNLNNRNTF